MFCRQRQVLSLVRIGIGREFSGSPRASTRERSCSISGLAVV
jgi:hypothetical protein